MFWKKKRGYRYCNHDVGHALGALRFSASLLGWKLSIVEGLSDKEIARALGLTRTDDFYKNEEEKPDVLCLVVPQKNVTAPIHWTIPLDTFEAFEHQ